MAQLKLEDLLSEEEKNNIIFLYRNNTSLREIEKITGKSRTAISRMLERLGEKTTKGNHYKKNSFNYNFFEKIDNELSAYWLGFLYADGCILTHKYGEQSFKLALSIEDEEIVQKYKEDLKSTYPIRYDESKHRKNPKHAVQVIQEYYSQKTVNDLKAAGCVERKSSILAFPSEDIVPKEYIYDFIRGYFDGDGSISISEKYTTLSFVGTKDFISSLSQYFEGGTVYQDKRKVNSWYYSQSGKQEIVNSYHLMYDNKTRYMKRKYDKFQLLL